MSANLFTPEIVGWAQAAQKTYQIPASLILSAAMIESGLGRGTPPGSNNWFGIKDVSGVQTSTREETAGGVSYTIRAGFMIFKTPADGFMYYAHLLGTFAPYNKMVTAFLKSPRGPADVQALSNALTGVYATARNYGPALIGVQKSYNLYQFDQLPSAAAPAQPPEKPTMPESPTQFNVAQANAPAVAPSVTDIANVFTTAISAAAAEAASGSASSGVQSIFAALTNDIEVVAGGLASAFGGPIIGALVNVGAPIGVPILVQDIENALGGLFKHLGLHAGAVAATTVASPAKS